MTTLAGGSNITLTLTDYDSVTVSTQGVVLVDAISGLGVTAGRIAEHTGVRTFGPYIAGQFKLTAQGAAAQYEVADGVAPTAGGGSALTTKDEGVSLSTATTSIDFVGAGVVVTNTGGAVTVTVAGGGSFTASSTDTMTNKRIAPRSFLINAGTTPAIGATPAINTDNCDRVVMTGITANITNLTTNLTGTPTHGETIVYEFQGNGNYTIGWGTGYVSGGTINLPAAMVTNTRLRVYLEYDSTLGKQVCVGVS